ncbi:MAG: hypothetical protein QGF67_14000 [Lentisphaeria bacterium]|jgi:hypothetical protein|nr:hypothetical protein [Lentisphaeria bacterium]MDP7742551.1 hypothetical protein [Lentisphaeria bacterium]
MKGLVLLFDVVLIIAAVMLTRQAWTQLSAEPQNHQPEYDDSSRSVIVLPPRQAHAQIPPIDSEQSDISWQRALFHPDRTFEIIAPTTENDSIETPTGFEQYELVGIARVGDTACASIIVHALTGSQSNRSRTQRRLRKNRNAPPSATKAKGRQAKKENRAIYSLNETVGETGYVLSEIGTDSVILTMDGKEDIELLLDTADDRSKARRTTASRQARAQQARQSKEKQIAAKQIAAKVSSRERSSTKPKPPVPPPPPNANSLPPPPGATGKSVQNQRRANSQSRNANTAVANPKGSQK